MVEIGIIVAYELIIQGSESLMFSQKFLVGGPWCCTEIQRGLPYFGVLLKVFSSLGGGGLFFTPFFTDKSTFIGLYCMKKLF